MTDEQNARAAALPWPPGWRWTKRRARAYRARGTGQVRTVNVDVDGAREPAVLLPMRRTSRLQGIGFAVLGVLFAVMTGVVAVAGVLDREWTAVPGVLVLGALAGIFGTAAVAGLRGRKDAMPGLRLTPTRVVFDGGVPAHGQLAVSWNEIRDMRAFVVRYGMRRILPRPWHNWLGIDAHDPSTVLGGAGHAAAARITRAMNSDTVIAVPDKRFAMNPLVAFHAVDYYLNHPAVRGELATHDGVRRVAGFDDQVVPESR
ncbi:hypothetical protein EF847_09660 [Actinobacteria bacterium YIM 96077]|uniref:Uncharacterized protein n=1 Tax=Phytoactinopolyspora halophila TaxID=1981511 RepID=A0A329QLF9_9ACTN|nr:hypothetical protein [Phytoactinopolyspora halophila]AYY12933.1 hypothetical protein EF847_09660 [Actinobacteria bacterium YIM 96077]RAW13197.1 hypothetical protein DPM12_12685 [Phytoactinopolyspora halophila]